MLPGVVLIGARPPIRRNPHDSVTSRGIRVLQAVDQKQVPKHRDPGMIYTGYISHAVRDSAHYIGCKPIRLGALCPPPPADLVPKGRHAATGVALFGKYVSGWQGYSTEELPNIVEAPFVFHNRSLYTRYLPAHGLSIGLHFPLCLKSDFGSSMEQVSSLSKFRVAATL